MINSYYRYLECDDGGTPWVPDPAGRRCRLHDEVFGALSVCTGCAYGLGNPPCPPDIERPDYWIDCTWPVIVREPSGQWYEDKTRTGAPALRCLFHDRTFEITEACAECLVEDAGES